MNFDLTKIVILCEQINSKNKKKALSQEEISEIKLEIDKIPNLLIIMDSLTKKIKNFEQKNVFEDLILFYGRFNDLLYVYETISDIIRRTAGNYSMKLKN